MCLFLTLFPVLMTAAPDPAAAHVTKRSGPFELELGWGVEPPRVGAENSVEVEVSNERGEPVAVPAGALSVEVVFGSAATTLPLVPVAAPGSLEASITPTRPGTYAFTVSGAVGGHEVEVGATCSEASFECVEPAGATEFPVEDPSGGDLALRLERDAARLGAARDRADGARVLAIVALALGAAALAVSVAAARRRGSGRS